MPKWEGARAAEEELWYLDHSNLMGLANALEDAGCFFGDTKNMLGFFEKPYNWEAEWRRWNELGKPNTDDKNFNAFMLDPRGEDFRNTENYEAMEGTR